MVASGGIQWPQFIRTKTRWFSMIGSTCCATDFHWSDPWPPTATDHDPSVTDFRYRLGGSHRALGDVLVRMGKLAEAEAEYRASIAINQNLVNDNPAEPRYRNRLAMSHQGLGVLLFRTDKATGAEAAFRTAIVHSQKAVEDAPAVPRFRGILAGSHDGLGRLLSRTGKEAEAETETRGAKAIRQQLADDERRHGSPQPPGESP
jgi:tetratricopeptide (TPR) repeat protein